jgi:hypothetical protein
MAGMNVREESMFKRKPVKESYDKENQRPVIRSSICTGEQVAGFKDVRTGRFTEVMVIRDGKDMEEFTAKYDIPAEDIKKEW